VKRIIVLTALLAGCATYTVEDLRQKASSKAFEVDQNYQAVYRTVVGQARKCYEMSTLGARRTVQGDLYTDIRSGHVMVTWYTGGPGLEADTFLASDITALGDKRTRVVTYYAPDSDGAASVVEHWVKDGLQECRK
jgi:hypothetical protein